MINYNFVWIEGGKERKNKDNLINAEFEKKLQLDQCKGESEREINKEVEASGESERVREQNKQTNKREEWAENRRNPKFIFLLFNVSHNICLHIYFS